MGSISNRDMEGSVAVQTESELGTDAAQRPRSLELSTEIPGSWCRILVSCFLQPLKTALRLDASVTSTGLCAIIRHFLLVWRGRGISESLEISITVCVCVSFNYPPATESYC